MDYKKKIYIICSVRLRTYGITLHIISKKKQHVKDCVVSLRLFEATLRHTVTQFQLVIVRTITTILKTIPTIYKNIF